MLVNDTISVTYSGTDGSKCQGAATETGTTRVAVDTNLPSSSTNVPVSAAFTVANMKSLILLATGGDLTLKTNSSSSPGNTISLKAGIPLTWGASSGYFPNPFTVDVTSFFVTCSASTRLQAIVLTI
jgi:hypothetical protein